MNDVFLIVCFGEYNVLILILVFFIVIIDFLMSGLYEKMIFFVFFGGN